MSIHRKIYSKIGGKTLKPMLGVLIITLILISCAGQAFAVTATCSPAPTTNSPTTLEILGYNKNFALNDVKTLDTPYTGDMTINIQKPGGLVPYNTKFRGIDMMILNAVNYYIITANSYVVNGLLRAPQNWWTNPNGFVYRLLTTILPLDKGEAYSPVTHDISLYRGVTANFASKVLGMGGYWDGGYASTSYDLTIPIHDYVGTMPSGTNVTVYVINRTVTDKALYVDESQRELILPRGLDWNASVDRTVTVGNLTIVANFPLKYLNPRYVTPPTRTIYNNVTLIYLTERKLN